MTKASHVYVLYIATTPEKVWTAITQGEITREYWFHSNVSSWTPGVKWEHVRPDNKTVDIAGTVLEAAAPHRLVFTWSNPGDLADSSKVSRVAFDIAVHKPRIVKLTVTHDELAAGSDMEKGVTRGWPQVLSNLKSFLETGKAMEMW